MDEKIRLEENELIRKWQECPDENIALYFFNKYKEDILTINYSKIQIKFSSLPLDREDFFYNVWKSVLTSLKEYDFRKNATFKSLLVRKTYLSSIKEAVKFIRNNHIVLNNSYSYERLLDKNKNFKFGPDGQAKLNSDFYKETKEFIDTILEFNKRYSTNYLKRIIYLRSLGYTIKEISEKLKQPLKDIKAVMNYIYEIAKKMYD